MSAVSLSIGLTNYQLLRERLLTEYPLLDEETVSDSLEGITDLNEIIAAVIRSALVDEALRVGLRSRLDEMRQRLTRLELRCEKKREMALEAMSQVGLRKLEQPDFTASVRAGLPTLVVVNEGDIPPDYWVPQAPKLDRHALLAKIKRGHDIPGVQLGNAKPILTVRTK